MIADNDNKIVWSAVAEKHAGLCETLEMLEKSEFTFHLGGSWFFACATPESYVDLIVAYSASVVAELEEMGFQSMCAMLYSDVDPNVQLTSDVMEKGSVQVSIVRCLEAKLIARDVMSKYFAKEHQGAGFESRNRAWKLLIDAASAVMDEFADLPF